MGIFDRLGYNPTAVGNNVIEFSANVVNYMNSIPALLEPWQMDDIANSAVSGYFKNPVANVTNNIWNTSNSIIAITGLSSSNINQIYVAASNLSVNAANSFFAHTNRISGVSPITGNTAELPHYSTAIGSGKVLATLVFQSDGVQNNAPIIGNFTSLFIENDLVSYYTRIQGYPTTIQNSMIATDDGLGGFTYSSNLSQATANAMVANLTSIMSLMDSRRNGDVNFYNNSQSVIADYKAVKQFSNMGQTQTELINLVGSDKLKERLNS